MTDVFPMMEWPGDGRDSADGPDLSSKIVLTSLEVAERALQDCKKLEAWHRDHGSHEGLGVNRGMPIGILWETRRVFRQRNQGLDVQFMMDQAQPTVRVIETG